MFVYLFISIILLKFALILFLFEKEGYPILDPYYYSKISKEDLEHILRSNSSTKISLIDERIEILRDTGKILIKVNNQSNNIARILFLF